MWILLFTTGILCLSPFMGFAANLNLQPASLSRQAQLSTKQRDMAERFLILAPERSNYFYASEADRVATALCSLGCHVEIASLRSFGSVQEINKYDRALFFNLCDILVDFDGDKATLLASVKRVQTSCTECFLVMLESLRAKWFAENLALFSEAKLDYIVDIGYFDQAHLCPPEFRARYLHVFNGLSQTEKRFIRQHFAPSERRPIPWALVGHQTPERASFALDLTRHYDPRGIVYLPALSFVRTDGPHINESQIKRILTLTRYYICYSHLTHYYLEAIRFRTAALTGSVPIKIISSITDLEQHDEKESLFPYLHLHEDLAAQTLAEMDFEAIRYRFADDMLLLPDLEEGLLAVFCSHKQIYSAEETIA